MLRLVDLVLREGAHVTYLRWSRPSPSSVVVERWVVVRPDGVEMECDGTLSLTSVTLQKLKDKDPFFQDIPDIVGPEYITISTPLGSERESSFRQFYLNQFLPPDPVPLFGPREPSANGLPKEATSPGHKFRAPPVRNIPLRTPGLEPLFRRELAESLGDVAEIEKLLLERLRGEKKTTSDP